MNEGSSTVSDECSAVTIGTVQQRTRITTRPTRASRGIT